MPADQAQSVSAAQIAPDCDTNAIEPARAAPRENVALRPMAGRMMPRQFGPISRKPLVRAVFRTSPSNVRPAVPVSPKPALSTTAWPVPARAASCSTLATAHAGVTTTAKSAACGNAASDLQQAMPSMLPPPYLGLTAYNAPLNPPLRKFANTACPSEPARALAPTTATLRGANMCCR